MTLFYNFISPSLIQFIFFKKILISGVMIAGKINDIKIRPNQSKEVIATLVPLAISLTQPLYTPI